MSIFITRAERSGMKNEKYNLNNYCSTFCLFRSAPTPLEIISFSGRGKSAVNIELENCQ